MVFFCFVFFVTLGFLAVTTNRTDFKGIVYILVVHSCAISFSYGVFLGFF